MGCDIHAYPEYKRKDSQHWNSFGGNINLGRNYWLFGLMSKGVRSEFEESIPARGMPENCGYKARNDNQIYISETMDDDDCCTLEMAKKWAKHGSKIIYQNDKPTWVTNPDWHSHSCLTPEELEKVIIAYKAKDGATKYVEPEYEALLQALKSFESQGFEARLVFWFDN